VHEAGQRAPFGRGAVARQVVPVRRNRVAEFGSERRGPKKCRSLRSAVRHVAESSRAGTSSEEKLLLEAKGDVSSDPGGKARGIDVRCETALSSKRKGSLRKEVRRSNVHRRKTSRIVARRLFSREALEAVSVLAAEAIESYARVTRCSW
jgi:hypothetical protein